MGAISNALLLHGVYADNYGTLITGDNVIYASTILDLDKGIQQILIVVFKV